MAQACISHRWPDGSKTEVEVYADDSFLDVIAQVAHEALLLWRATCTDEAKS